MTSPRETRFSKNGMLSKTKVSVWIDVAQRIVPGIAVLAPALRVGDVVRELFRVRARAPLRAGEVPRAEVIEAGFAMHVQIGYAGSRKHNQVVTTRMSGLR